MSWHTAPDSLCGWEQSSSEHTDAGRKGHSVFHEAYFSFRLQSRQIRRLGGPALECPVLLAGSDYNPTGNRTRAFCSLFQEPLLSPPRVLDSNGFWRWERSKDSGSLCLSKAALFPWTGTARHQRGALHARLFDYPGTWTAQCQSSAGRNAGVSGTAFAEQRIGIPSKRGLSITCHTFCCWLVCLLYLVAN